MTVRSSAESDRTGHIDHTLVVVEPRRFIQLLVVIPQPDHRLVEGVVIAKKAQCRGVQV